MAKNRHRTRAQISDDKRKRAVYVEPHQRRLDDGLQRKFQVKVVDNRAVLMASTDQRIEQSTGAPYGPKGLRSQWYIILRLSIYKDAHKIQRSEITARRFGFVDTAFGRRPVPMTASRQEW